MSQKKKTEGSFIVAYGHRHPGLDWKQKKVACKSWGLGVVPGAQRIDEEKLEGKEASKCTVDNSPQ